MYEEFAKRFKQLREEKSMTQLEMAQDFTRKSGVHLSTTAVSGYENARRVPDVPLLEKLADYFDVGIDYILGRSNERDGSKRLPDLSDETQVEMAYLKLIVRAKSARISPERLGRLIEFLEKQE